MPRLPSSLPLPAMSRCAQRWPSVKRDRKQPAVIAPPEFDAPLRPLVVNLRDAAVEGAFERVLEVVPADDDARGPLRERWKQYKARGMQVNKHDM